MHGDKMVAHFWVYFSEEVELERVLSLLDTFRCAKGDAISGLDNAAQDATTHLPVFAANEIDVGVRS